VDFVDYDPDNFRRGADFILSNPPKWLIIHGGEPTSVKELRGVLSQIREKRSDVFITSETNMTYLKQVLELTDYVNHWEVSCDGLGEINRQVRGISGDVIIKHLRELMPVAREKNVKVSISVVISTVNYKHLDELMDALYEVDPNIDCIYFVLHPKSNPLSVAHAEETWSEFQGILKQLQGKYEGKITYPEAIPVQEELRCFAQYFISHVHESGEPYFCKRDHHLQAFKQRQFGGGGMKSMKEFVRHSWQLFDTLVFRKHAPLCMQPCDWGYNVHKMIFGKEALRSLEDCYALHGATLNEDGERLLNFLQKKAGSDLTLSQIKQYLIASGKPFILPSFYKEAGQDHQKTKACSG
jgi:hypothetical protein